ncbi:MAG: hypothetical protein PGN11_22355 [Quadrisphaera sp.]
MSGQQQGREERRVAVAAWRALPRARRRAVVQAAQRGVRSHDEEAFALAVAVARTARRSPGDVWAPGGHRVVSSWSVAGAACVLAAEAALFAVLDAVPVSLAVAVAVVALVLVAVAAVRVRAARRTRMLLLQAPPAAGPAGSAQSLQLPAPGARTVALPRAASQDAVTLRG